MSKSKRKNREQATQKAKIIGNIAFWVSFAGIMCLPLPWVWRAVCGLAVGSGLKKLINIMGTPLEGLHTENGERVKEEPVTEVGTPEDDHAKEVVANGLSLLEQIGEERDEIGEYVMTRRLKELDELVRKMLQTVVEHPDETSRLRKFISYYLPTTLKLLQSYRTMKVRGVSYSEMTATRDHLIQALDKILQAAQKQLDAMYKDDMLDMSADMDVLEQMLKRDGYMESALDEALRMHAENADEPEKTFVAPKSAGTAAAQQMAHGAPVLEVPEDSAASDQRKHTQQHMI